MNKILLASALIIPLMLFTAQMGYAGNPLPPPPAGSKLKYVGPDITGTLTFEDISTPETIQVKVTFSGSWKNTSCVGEHTTTFQIDFFDCVSPEWLLGTCTETGCQCTGYPQMLPDSLVPNSCYPNKDIYWYPVVYKVMHFTENGNTKSAEIVVRFPVLNP